MSIKGWRSIKKRQRGNNRIKKEEEGRYSEELEKRIREKKMEATHSNQMNKAIIECIKEATRNIIRDEKTKKSLPDDIRELINKRERIKRNENRNDKNNN